MRLKGKVALVTGSSSGIGAGIAKAMAAEGADIIVNYRSNKTGAEKTAEAIGQMGREVLIVQGDVGNKDDVRKLFDQIRQSFGKLDILVNNAGVSPKMPFKDTSENDWNRIIDTNLKSVFLCCKEALSIMASGGAILNICNRSQGMNVDYGPNNDGKG